MKSASRDDAKAAGVSNGGGLLRSALGAGLYPFLSRWLDPSRRYCQFTYAQILSRLMPPGAAWLDAGCGHQVFKLNSSREEAEIIARTRLAVGCDLSSQAVQAHRSLKLKLAADLCALPFADNSFDVVTLNYVAEHLQHPAVTFSEIARVLRRDGLAIIVTPNAQGYFVKLTRIGRKFLPESFVRRFILFREFRSADDVFPTFYRANTRNDLRCHLEPAGMSEREFQLLKDPAMFNFVAPLAALEMIVMRFLSFLGFSTLAAGTIIGVYRRTGSRLSPLECGVNGTVQREAFDGSRAGARC